MSELISIGVIEHKGLLHHYDFLNGDAIIELRVGDEGGMIYRSFENGAEAYPVEEASDPFTQRVALTQKIIEMGVEDNEEKMTVIAMSRGIKV